jgi:HD-GYP domain-containing protein (c-di-GMP phosphodiesterase class II)
MLLSIGLALLWARLRRIERRDRARTDYFRGVSLAPNLQEAISALSEFFRQIEPDILRVGIYLREGNSFRLAGGGSKESGNGRPTGAEMEESILPDESYRQQGRFHVHTFHQQKGRVAVRIVAYNRISMEKITAELYCLSALLEGLAKLAGAQTELTRTQLTDESATIFNPVFSDRREYFELVGVIVLNAYRLDTLRILSPEGDSLLGAPDYQEGSGKLLYLRNTDLKFQLYRKSGLSSEDLTQIGRFLDIISAVHAMYSSEQHIDNYLSFLEASIEVYENNDPFERRHSEKVSTVALALGSALGLDADRLTALRYACRFHDIGMLGQLSGIASKSGSLSEKEHARIKFHPAIGRNITKALDSRYPVSHIIQQHHEFLDGSGYPGAVGGPAISTEARILALSEVLVGMVSNRPHRQGKSMDVALRELEGLVPHQLDAAVFAALLKQRESIAGALKNLG